jgi:hypothetical protein
VRKALLPSQKKRYVKIALRKNKLALSYFCFNAHSLAAAAVILNNFILRSHKHKILRPKMEFVGDVTSKVKINLEKCVPSVWYKVPRGLILKCF